MTGSPICTYIPIVTFNVAYKVHMYNFNLFISLPKYIYIYIYVCMYALKNSPPSLFYCEKQLINFLVYDMGVYFRILHLRALPFTIWVPCYRSHTHLRRGFIRSFDYILYFALFYSPPPHIVGSQLFLMIWYPRFQISSQWIYFLRFFFCLKNSPLILFVW